MSLDGTVEEDDCIPDALGDSPRNGVDVFRYTVSGYTSKKWEALASRIAQLTGDRDVAISVRGGSVADVTSELYVLSLQNPRVQLILSDRQRQQYRRNGMLDLLERLPNGRYRARQSYDQCA